MRDPEPRHLTTDARVGGAREQERHGGQPADVEGAPCVHEVTRFVVDLRAGAEEGRGYEDVAGGGRGGPGAGEGEGDGGRGA